VHSATAPLSPQSGRQLQQVSIGLNFAEGLSECVTRFFRIQLNDTETVREIQDKTFHQLRLEQQLILLLQLLEQLLHTAIPKLNDAFHDVAP